MSETQESSAFKISAFVVLPIVLIIVGLGVWLCSSNLKIREILGIIAIALSGLTSLSFSGTNVRTKYSTCY